MKIKFEEIKSRQLWIHKELLHSLDGDTISKAKEEAAFDVKILVNGSELEPKFLNDLVHNMSTYIEGRAKSMLNDKMMKANEKAQQLLDIVESASDKIIRGFDV